jgi:hypothetical protein
MTVHLTRLVSVLVHEVVHIVVDVVTHLLPVGVFGSAILGGDPLDACVEAGVTAQRDAGEHHHLVDLAVAVVIDAVAGLLGPRMGEGVQGPAVLVVEPAVAVAVCRRGVVIVAAGVVVIVAAGVVVIVGAGVVVAEGRVVVAAGEFSPRSPAAHESGNQEKEEGESRRMTAGCCQRDGRSRRH